MRITKVTPVNDARSEPNVELYVGEYDDWTDDWHRAEINALQSEFDASGIDYQERRLMQKAVGFDDAALVGLATYAIKKVFDLLIAWLPAREGRKVRVRFKDGTEIEAHSVEELEKLRERFLSDGTDDEE